MSKCRRGDDPGGSRRRFTVSGTAEVEIPYGRDDSGRMRHISEVCAGLRCDCTCAECDGRLVAYKGRRKQHHFGHYAGRTCLGALETALHQFAKQALADSTALMLPPLVACCGDEQIVLRQQQEFRYEKVDVELTMPNMRPDVVVRRGEAVLLVEVAVRHPCENAKLAHIRERRLPAIEIDLSRMRHDASPQEQVDAVLRSAPRHWLFNRHVEEAEAELRRQALEQASAEKDRHDREWGKLAADMTAAYKADAGKGHPGWLSAVGDASLIALVGESIQGDACFVVPASVWQAAVVHQFVLGPAHYGDFSPSSVTEWLAGKGFLKPSFQALPTRLSVEMSAYLAATVTGFRPPIDVVAEFMATLAQKGLLYKRRTCWSASTTTADGARRQRDYALAARQRLSELSEEIDAIKKLARRGASIDFATWAAERHEGMKETPEQIAISGGFPFDELKRRLQSLKDTLKPNAYPTSGDLLGLPLGEDQEARRREQEEREETWRRDRERREQLAAERRRVETRSFLVDIGARAREFLGEKAGTAWVSQHLPPPDGKAAGLELRPEQMNSMRWALETQQRRLIAEAEAQVAAAAMAKSCLDRLRAEAARDPELRSPDRLEVWIGGTQYRLGGARPRDFCVDQRTLDQCLALLPSRLTKKVRSPRR